jgi:L-arabonate dehydrase
LAEANDGSGPEAARSYQRHLDLDLSDTGLEKRRKEWKAPPAPDVRGYVRLYCDHVNQADKAVDVDFLGGGSGAPIPRESH